MTTEMAIGLSQVGSVFVAGIGALMVAVVALRVNFSVCAVDSVWAMIPGLLVAAMGAFCFAMAPLWVKVIALDADASRKTELFLKLSVIAASVLAGCAWLWVIARRKYRVAELAHQQKLADEARELASMGFPDYMSRRATTGHGDHCRNTHEGW